MESADMRCVSSPPYGCDWPTNGMVLNAWTLVDNGLSATNLILSIAEAQAKAAASWPSLCTVTQTVWSARYSGINTKVTFDIGFCGAEGGVKGAEHWNNPGHAPSYAPVSKCLGIGCGCQAGPVWYVGTSHDIFHIRDLNHDDESEEDKKYQHCLGIVWSGRTTNLLSFVESFGIDLTDLVKWEVNGKQQTKHLLNIGSEPGHRNPKIFRIKMLEKSTDTVWDRFILVVCNQDTQTHFNTWYDRFSVETAWLAELPAAYTALGAFIDLGMNALNPEPASTNLWKDPDTPGKYIHHTARWQMRSKTTPGGHGHQACYDAEGKIILTGVSAGTADYGSTTSLLTKLRHLTQDVYPFIHALQLDGNPCRQNWTALDHALIHEGDCIKQYIECRPAIPNGKQLLLPGQLPGE
ncbi:MAG: hypothetical protein FWH21_05000 [Kiritimatiellaeota bacterium]|nr:hypothetical protein [Kiritimatiellota bacterium]